MKNSSRNQECNADLIASGRTISAISMTVVIDLCPVFSEIA